MAGKAPSPVELLRLIENLVRAGSVMAVDYGDGVDRLAQTRLALGLH